MDCMVVVTFIGNASFCTDRIESTDCDLTELLFTMFIFPLVPLVY